VQVCVVTCVVVRDGWWVQVRAVAKWCRCVSFCVLMCVIAGRCRFV
jgi:hypothetical protein